MWLLTLKFIDHYLYYSLDKIIIVLPFIAFVKLSLENISPGIAWYIVCSSTFDNHSTSNYSQFY